jgi:hypothetical protein
LCRCAQIVPLRLGCAAALRLKVVLWLIGDRVG